MMKRYLNSTLLPVLLVGATTASALEVDREVMPRVTVAGRVVATADAVDLVSNPQQKSGINSSDSTLLLRLDKRLYGGGGAGAVVGFCEHDESVVLPQLHAFYREQNYRVTLGRTRLLNSAIELPTLRDDDLLAYSHVGNVSSNSDYDQLYAQQLVLDIYPGGGAQRITLWGGERHNGDGVSGPQGFDSHGGGYLYETPEALHYVARLRKAALLVDRQRAATATGDEWLSAVIAGVDLNLNRDPTASWSLAAQWLGNRGVDSVAAAQLLHSAPDHLRYRAQTAAQSLVAAVRYTHRPNLLTRWQAAMSVAVKRYDDAGDARQWSVVPSLRYRLGSGVELVGQGSYTRYDEGLGGGSDRRLQLGLSFSLDARFNDTVGERDSILNLEHGYLP